MIRIYLILFIFQFGQLLSAQELFIINEPASTIPKGVLGLIQFPIPARLNIAPSINTLLPVFIFMVNSDCSTLIRTKTYDSYQQNNFNIYLELMGKSYGIAQLSQRGNTIDIQSDALLPGQYLDAYIGVQRIMNSNDRIELSLCFPIINKSYRHFYPLLNLAWQKYFYFRKK